MKQCMVHGAVFVGFINHVKLLISNLIIQEFLPWQLCGRCFMVGHSSLSLGINESVSMVVCQCFPLSTKYLPTDFKLHYIADMGMC